MCLSPPEGIYGRMKKPLRFFRSQKTWLQQFSLIALVATVSAPDHASAAFLQDDSPQNLLSIEVESATSNTPRSGDSWSTPSVAIGGFSGTGDLRAEPDDGDLINEGYSETSPELSTLVQIRCISVLIIKKVSTPKTMEFCARPAIPGATATEQSKLIR